ncbi:phiSA1p31-related protein [Streptomyces sp. NPDC056728]
MTETFTAGEEVNLTTQGRKVRVEFGPFTTSMCQAAYVVKNLDGNQAGHSQSVPGSALERGPKFTVGDAVLVGTLRTPATVAAGPFRSSSNRTFYVLEYATATHETREESHLTKAQAAPRNVYRLAGVAYDLDARYVDNDGDVWSFNGLRRDGVPLMDSPDAGYGFRNYTLSSVISSFGPLKERA